MSGFELDKPKGLATNIHAHVECKTCGGDRVIVFETRPSVTSTWMKEHGLKARGASEQYVPCPDCNPNANTRREGHRSPDPAQVRERLARQ